MAPTRSNRKIPTVETVTILGRRIRLSRSISPAGGSDGKLTIHLHRSLNGPPLARSSRRLERPCQDRFHDRVRSEVILTGDVEDIGKLAAGAIDPALDGADGDVANS